MKNNVLSFPKRKELDNGVGGFHVCLPRRGIKFEQAQKELTNAVCLLSALESRSSIGKREAFELRESGEKIRKCLAVFANMIALLEAGKLPIEAPPEKELPPTER